MKGKALDWNKSCKLHFGAYAQVYKTLEKRTQGAICLGPTGNLQGTYKLFSLLSRKKITRRQFTELPTPTIVMKRVAARPLAKNRTKD